jgi:hypothetical protein
LKPNGSGDIIQETNVGQNNSRSVPPVHVQGDAMSQAQLYSRDRQGSFRQGEYRTPRSSEGFYSRQTDNYTSPRYRNRYTENHFPRQHFREDLSIKVKTFDSRETDWFTYKIYFEAIASQAFWSPRTKCVRLMGALQGNLTGVMAGLPQPIMYKELIHRLDSIHGITNSKEDAILKLQACRKYYDESMNMFAERVRQLVERAFPNFNPIDKDEQALKIFLQGLPTKNDIRLNMRVKAFKTLHEAAIYGARLEQILKDEKHIENNFSNKNVSHRSSQIENQNESEMTSKLNQLTVDIKNLQTTQKHQLHSFNNFQKQFSGDVKIPVENKMPHVKNLSNNGKVTKNKQNSQCFLCGELGHWRNECPQLQQSENNDKSLN